MTASAPLTVGRADLLVDGSDAAFRQMLHDFLAFSARLEQIRQRFGAALGLSGVQYTLLVTIRQLQGGEGVGVKAVAEHLAFSAPFVTVETGRLAALGVVEKLPDPADGRRVRLLLTPRGRELLARLAPMQQEINDVLFEPVTAANFAEARAMARDLRQAAERAVLLSDYLLDDQRGAR
jgi:DNA-binding MarR family transcriptional regulator